MIIHGKDIILASTTSGVAFAAAKSCELDVRADTLETSTAATSDWRTFIAERKSWTMHLNHLVMAVKTNKQMVGQTISVTFGKRGDNSDTLSGTAIIEEWKVTGTKGNLAQGSFSLRGTGALT